MIPSFWKTVAITLPFVTTMVFSGSAAQAGYQPPNGAPPSQSSVSNGSRSSGCDATGPIPLTALAPVEHVGQASATQPTLMWYVSASSPYRAYLGLYEVTSDGVSVVDEAEIFPESGGLEQYSIPSDTVLKGGQRYIWSVAIACNPDADTYELGIEVELDVVDLPSALSETLETTVADGETATLYAENGYWYDALRAALDNAEQSGNEDLIVSLLTDLANYEDNSHGETLRRIAGLLTQDADMPSP